MTITYRLVKGSPLTITELDDNFHDLDDRVTSIEDSPPEARGISEITQSGDSLFVEMTDSTQEGPFTLPAVDLNFRGEWTAATNYLVNDIITANGNVYLVLTAHTSEATFDPNANDGSGGDFYGLLLEMPELSLPLGGGEGYVLAKASSSDFDTQWLNNGVPAGGNANEVLAKFSADDYDTQWINSGSLNVAPVLTVTATTLSPTLANANSYHRCTSNSGCVVFIPADEEVDFDVGTELHFVQRGVISVVIAQSAGSAGPEITINTRVGYEPETAAIGAVITAKKVAVNEWDVFGGLAPENTSDTA